MPPVCFVKMETRIRQRTRAVGRYKCRRAMKYERANLNRMVRSGTWITDQWRRAMIENIGNKIDASRLSCDNALKNPPSCNFGFVGPLMVRSCLMLIDDAMRWQPLLRCVLQLNSERDTMLRALTSICRRRCESHLPHMGCFCFCFRRRDRWCNNQ